VKVNVQGQMMINLRYESVPHFCFSCGRIGHAALNCEDSSLEDHGVAYGEELRASPSRRVKEIMVKPTSSKVARPLFQVSDMPSHGKQTVAQSMGGGTSSGDRNQTQRVGNAGGAGTHNWFGEQFVNIVKELHAACNSTEASWATQGSGGKERVSFGTNMTTEGGRARGPVASSAWLHTPVNASNEGRVRGHVSKKT
jgi:hypothetical protein